MTVCTPALLPTERVTCPICGKGEGPTCYQDRARGVANVFTVIRCRCGLHYVNPAPPPWALADYYSRYETYFQADRERLLTDTEKMRLARRDMRLIAQWHPHPGRLLDVGCGDGQMLTAARELGWEGVGTELGLRTNPAAQAHLADFQVHCCPLEEVPGEGEFDLVALRQVLEHMAAPREALMAARRLLRPRGLLFVHVPNVGNLRTRLRGRPLANQLHLWHFSPRTLRELLRVSGFEVIAGGCLDHRAVGSWRRYVRAARLAAYRLMQRCGLAVADVIYAVARRA